MFVPLDVPGVTDFDMKEIREHMVSGPHDRPRLSLADGGELNMQ